MPAYVIVTYRSIKDAAKMKEYAKLATPTLMAFKAIPRVVNKPGIALEGGEVPNLVLLEFKDVDTARAWYDSPGYQAALAVRQQGAEAEVVIVEGLGDPRSMAPPAAQ